MTDNKNEHGKEPLPIFYPPQMDLKQKVGGGGLNRRAIEKAQNVIDQNNTDFIEVAQPYLVVFNEGIKEAKKLASDDHGKMIEGILFPAMQLKANGELFHYPIITVIGGQLLAFLERIGELNHAALDIVDAFDASIKMIFKKKLKGEITAVGQEIIDELDAVCARFFEKYPENIHPRFLEDKS